VLPTRTSLRRARFFLLEKIALPIATPLLRLLIRTWRLQGDMDPMVEWVLREPRVVLATYHGMLLHLLAFSHLPPERRRRLVVLLSPSRDGHLLAAALARFGIDHVQGTTGSRGVAGAREFVARIAAGDVGVVAVDGPRGPAGVAKPGTVRMSLAAQASLVVMATSASYGVTLGSWDRSHLPGPFARVQLTLQACPFAARASDDDNALVVQEALLSAARAIHSPIVRPAA
jgi:lysophospholipid acyltransferase (LPLAT)-like uncharacterized protein